MALRSFEMICGWCNKNWFRPRSLFCCFWDEDACLSSIVNQSMWLKQKEAGRFAYAPLIPPLLGLYPENLHILSLTELERENGEFFLNAKTPLALLLMQGMLFYSTYHISWLCTAGGVVSNFTDDDSTPPQHPASTNTVNPRGRVPYSSKTEST